MTTTPKVSTPPTPPTSIETVECERDHGFLAQTEVAFDPGLSLAYTAQVVEALTPVLDRVMGSQAGDRFLNVRSVVVGYPHHPWGNVDPNSTVASCMITIDVPLR